MKIVRVCSALWVLSSKSLLSRESAMDMVIISVSLKTVLNAVNLTNSELKYTK